MSNKKDKDGTSSGEAVAERTDSQHPSLSVSVFGLGKLLFDELPKWRSSVDNLSSSILELAEATREQKKNTPTDDDSKVVK